MSFPLVRTDKGNSDKEGLLEESRVWSHKNPEIGCKKKNAQQVRGHSLQSQRILRLGKP
nr:MAG TPA: hypothetical protein [Caudoviricetes sp.]